MPAMHQKADDMRTLKILALAALTALFLIAPATASSIVTLQAPNKAKLKVLGEAKEEPNQKASLNLGSLRTGEAALPASSYTLEERKAMRHKRMEERRKQVTKAHREAMKKRAAKRTGAKKRRVARRTKAGRAAAKKR